MTDQNQNQGQNQNQKVVHLCHALNCQTPVPPKLLMCLKHWKMVPVYLQRRVWKHYRPGQEVDKRPSALYLEVMKQAVQVVFEIEEDRKAGTPWPSSNS